jgi:hypothetical protein
MHASVLSCVCFCCFNIIMLKSALDSDDEADNNVDC